MNNSIPIIPIPKCEKVKSYRPGSKERKEIKNEYKKLLNKITTIPMFIDGQNITTNNIVEIYPPHNHKKLVGKYHKGN